MQHREYELVCWGSNKSKIMASMIVGLLLGGTSLMLFVAKGYGDLSEKSSKKSLEMLSQSIFQTLRVSMNVGDPKVVEATFHDAKKYKVFKT
jgi:methyl-accepting chemotaxis protein